MPTKWKIFRVVAIVQIIFSLIFIIAIFLGVKEDYESFDAYTFTMTSLCIFALLQFFVFCIYTLYLLHYNYPDTLISVNKNLIFLFLFCLYCLSTVLITILYFYCVHETIIDYNRNANDNMLQIFILVALTILLFTIFYILINALKLKKLIQNNAAEKQLAEIENFFLKQ